MGAAGVVCLSHGLSLPVLTDFLFRSELEVSATLLELLKVAELLLYLRVAAPRVSESLTLVNQGPNHPSPVSWECLAFRCFWFVYNSGAFIERQ